MANHNVFYNGRSVNIFETENEGFEFALSIEANETDIEYKNGDSVYFEANGGTYTTKEYSLDDE